MKTIIETIMNFIVQNQPLILAISAGLLAGIPLVALTVILFRQKRTIKELQESREAMDVIIGQQKQVIGEKVGSIKNLSESVEKLLEENTNYSRQLQSSNAMTEKFELRLQDEISSHTSELKTRERFHEGQMKQLREINHKLVVENKRLKDIDHRHEDRVEAMKLASNRGIKKAQEYYDFMQGKSVNDTETKPEQM